MHARFEDPAIVRGVRDTGGRVTLAIFECTKPVIAAINGAAVGIGATMTLAMDIRLASDKARIGFVFGKIGIVPEACSSWFLPRIVGISQALEWVYSADIIDAQEAQRGGLVKAVYPPEQLLRRSEEAGATFRRQALAGRNGAGATDAVSKFCAVASGRGASHRLARDVLHERRRRQGRRALVPGEACAAVQGAARRRICRRSTASGRGDTDR